jgi:hypothetical protein
LSQLPVKRHFRAKNKSHKIKPTYPTSSAIIAAKPTTTTASTNNSAKSAIITGNLTSNFNNRKNYKLNIKLYLNYILFCSELSAKQRLMQAKQIEMIKNNLFIFYTIY